MTLPLMQIACRKVCQSIFVMALAGLAPKCGLSEAIAQARAPRAASEPTGVTYGSSANGFAIVFHLRNAASAVAKQDGQDLLISLPGGLPPFDSQDLQTRGAGLLEAVSVGFDTLLLRLAPGTSSRIESSDTSLSIMLMAANFNIQASHAEDVEAGRGEQRLALLEAQLLARTGHLTEARNRLEALRTAMSGSAEPLAGLAGVEQQAGRWRRAVELYRQAAALSPDNPALAATADAIERSEASRVRFDVDYRRARGGVLTSPVDLTIGEVSGYQHVGEAWRVGAVIDSVGVRTRLVRRSDGTIEPFSGWRERAELFAQHDGLDGTVSVGSLFAKEHALGIGVLRRIPDDRGSTLLRIEYRRPNWDYTEGLINGATRDRVAGARTQRFSTRVTGRLELGYNRYGIRGKDDIARTTTFTAELRLGSLGGVPGLTAAYTVDGEYVDRRRAQRAPTDESFFPLPIVNREVHVATLGYARSVGDRWSGRSATFDSYGGYGVDRYGRGGPLAAASVGFAAGPVEMQIRASYVRNIGRARATAANVGGFLSVLF